MADVMVETYGDTVSPRAPLVRRTAWGAIFAGMFVAVSCQLLLTALGLAIGAATINPEREVNAAEGVGIGAGIWWLVSSMLSLFAGGMVTAWLAGFPRWVDGMLHGMVVWGLTVAFSAAAVMTGATTLLGGAVGGLQTAMTQPASPDSPLGALRVRAEQELDERLGGGSALPRDIERTLRNVIPEKQYADQQDRQRAANALQDNHGVPRGTAEEMVDEYLASGRGSVYGSPEDQRAMDRAGQRAADFVTSAATWTFFAMLLGLGAAAAGGAVGRPQFLLHDRDLVA